MTNLPSQHRKMLLTFLVAGVGAILAEHALKPYLKGKLRI